MQYSLDHALEAVVVLNLQHRVVEVLQVGHKVIDLGKGVLALSAIYRPRQRLQIIHMRLDASKVMLVVGNIIDWSHQGLEISNIFVEFLIGMVMLNVKDWSIHLFEIV